jgi:NitT/TauT family transport system permease protein
VNDPNGPSTSASPRASRAPGEAGRAGSSTDGVDQGRATANGSPTEPSAPVSRTKRRKLRIYGPAPRRGMMALSIGSFVLLLAAWWFASALHLASDQFLPSPTDVFNQLVDLAKAGTLWSDTVASVRRITVGFLLATAFALPIGALIGVYRWVDAAIEPPVGFIRYMPAVAFIPLTIVWVGIDENQKYLMVFIGTFFQQVLMVQDNFRRVPREYVEIGYTLGMREPNILRRIVFPAAAPQVWDTLRITLGWAWTYLVVAELVAAQSGLGYRTLVAQRFFQTDEIFGVILVIGFLGLIFDQSMRLVGHRLFRWSESKR